MKVLILGREKAIMDNVLPLIRNEGFEAVGVLSDREAIENIESGEFDAVIVGGAVEDTSRQVIRLASVERNISAIEIEKGNKVIETYLRDEIFPKLHELGGK